MSITRIALIGFLLPVACIGQILAADSKPVAAIDSAAVSEPSPPSTISKIDIDRVSLLYDLVDHYSDSLWPDFDIRKTPIAMNCDDNQELLIGHPSPPEEFRLYSDNAIPGQTLYIRDGCTRYGPRGGGWAVEVGGVNSAYMSTVEGDITTDQFLPILLHECFHVFQGGYREQADSAWAELPELDGDYSSLLSLESRLLYAALTDSVADVKHLASMFVAVREKRREAITPMMVRTEGELEYNEGTAEYVQTRLLELLARDSAYRHRLTIDDPRFHCFDSADREYHRMLTLILPAPEWIMTYMQAQYHHGMAQCYLLDQLSPGWKNAMRAKGSTQFGLLQAALALPDAARPELIAEAMAAFNYDSIAAEQNSLVDKQKAFLCDVIERPGCRYRIYHSAVPGGFNWKPAGPIHRVPNELMDEIDARHEVPTFGMDNIVRSNTGPSLWMGGFRHFEKAEMTFESEEVPILFRLAYFEWVDPDPATDGRDCIIDGTTDDGVTFRDMTMTTDGFVMTAKRARVERADGVVVVIPELPEAVSE